MTDAQRLYRIAADLLLNEMAECLGIPTELLEDSKSNRLTEWSAAREHFELEKERSKRFEKIDPDVLKWKREQESKA